MTTRLRVLDDGAWISVDDSREVRVSELWRLDAPDFCRCALADLVVENFQSVGVDGSTVEARVYGQCIACGETGVTGWVPVGRVHEGEFAELARAAVRSPQGRSSRQHVPDR
ncbi:hypothetical protein [Halorubrum halophilum]|nr:hypothetical protein [Halorubrum halophilum]